MNKKLTIGALLVLIVGIGGFWMSARFSNVEAATIGSVMSDYGFTEFRPASRHVPPGTLVHIAGSQPLSLGVICGPSSSLGLEIGDIPTSPTINTNVKAALDRDLQLDVGFLQTLRGTAALSDIANVTLKLSNVRVLELSDDMVVEGFAKRSTACKEALRFRIEQGQPVTIVKSAIIADVTYTATLKTKGSAEVTADIQDALATSLSSKVTTADNGAVKLTGTDLIWGIRDDEVLARYGLGLSATGNDGGDRNILATDDVVESVDIGDQARAQVPSEFQQIRYDVHPLRQVGRMDCWATVYTMMASWRDGVRYEVRDTVVTLGPEYQHYWRQNTGLPGGKERDFVVIAGMTAKPPAAYQLTGYVSMLDEHGPLWIITGNGISSHAKLLIGVFGPTLSEDLSSYQQATFEFIDPADGAFHYEPALDFMTEFEQEARHIVDTGQDDVDLRWQILHL